MYLISGYSLQFKKFGTKQWTVFDTVKTSNRRLDDLKPGTAYMVRLKSNNPYGASEPSEMVEFKTLESKYHSDEETSALLAGLSLNKLLSNTIVKLSITVETLKSSTKSFTYIASSLLFSLLILRPVSA